MDELTILEKLKGKFGVLQNDQLKGLSTLIADEITVLDNSGLEGGSIVLEENVGVLAAVKDCECSGNIASVTRAEL